MEGNPNMMSAESDYIKHIQHTFPDLDIQDVKINREGMVNVVVIVNQARVFRFPREPWGVVLLRQEAKALDLVRRYVDLPTPDWDYRSDEMVSYPLIPGDPLLTDDVLRMSEKEKDAVAETLAVFLKQVHSIPMAEIKAAKIDCSASARSIDDWLQLYQDVQETLFPLMWADGRTWVKRHFAPLLANSAFMDYKPRFVNGDLATYHLLFNPQTKLLNGIIDFGTAGIGDPAVDFAAIINQYGETFLRRMNRTYSEIREYIGRARFRTGASELAWVLRGIQQDENDMFVVHLGRARDMQPVDAAW
jgi:aminoglycoside 2''-phosphotransferase